MNKKNIIFVINSLVCGGAEKSLITLLNNFDYKLYNVDLLLIEKTGLFLKDVPKEVNILPSPINWIYFNSSIKESLKNFLKICRFDLIIARILIAFIFRFVKNKSVAEQYMWMITRIGYKTHDKKYDVAIGYLEKLPIYYIVNKILARIKIGWVHTDLEKLKLNIRHENKYFKKLDRIITVSNKCRDSILKLFMDYSSNTIVIQNLIDDVLIKNNSQIINEEISTEFINNTNIKIITIARLTYLKGIDLAAYACKLLIDNGYKISWYIIGDGEDKAKIKSLITELAISNNFMLLGIKENPYAYISQSDVYVQPSRYEGKSIAIDEVKLLRKPIVVTNYSTVTDQIINNKTGLIVEMNAESIFNGIKYVIDSPEYRKKIINNLLSFTTNNKEEINKLYKIIESV